MTTAAPTIRSEEVASGTAGPLLEAGDRLSREEFDRRYERMPELKHAELIEGIVYMNTKVRASHGIAHGTLAWFIGYYAIDTPGADAAMNTSVRLDMDNQAQPDVVLFKLPENGGQTRISADDFLEGPPELAGEIVRSSSSYDLHQKKEFYRRNGVREHLAWIPLEDRLVGWKLHEGDYHEIVPLADGVLKSVVFPGLWLDVQALLRDDSKAVLATLRKGLESVGHLPND